MTSSNTQCRASRCSTKLVRDVIGRLNEHKKKLVESIGFGSLLNFPDIRKMNRNLSVWLMERVDVETKTLVVDSRRVVQMDVNDVYLVFGIPCSGQKVLGGVPPSKEIKTNIMKSCFGTSQWEQRSVKAAQEAIEKEYPGEMSQLEQDAFKQCFVMFIMAALLAPGAKHDYACVDYWNAISDPLRIGDYNWAEYVMDRLIEGVVKLKSDLACGVKSPKITGCSLFLQVLYLDSIDTGVWNLEHSIFPRIKTFTFERMRGMILADGSKDSTPPTTGGFGSSQLRSPFEVCYHWAATYRPSGEWAGVCVQRALWQAAVQMAHVLNVPYEASGHLFAAMSDFQEQMDPTFGVQSLRLVSVLLTILHTYAKGYRRMNPSQPIDASITTGSVCRALMSMTGGVECTAGGSSGFTEVAFKRKRQRVEPPQQVRLNEWSGGAVSGKSAATGMLSSAGLCNDVDLMVVRAVAQCSLGLRERVLDDLVGVRSSGTGSSEEFADKSLSSGKNGKAPAPAAVGNVRSLDAVSVKMRPLLSGFNASLRSNSRDSWLHQILGVAEMGIDMMDEIIGHFKEREEAPSANHNLSGCRHFVESTFMARLTSGNDDMDEPSMQIIFASSHNGCDKRKIKMIIFPAILHNRWVCYAWRIEDNTIVVWDPMWTSSSTAVRHLHIKITCALKRSLEAVPPSIFPGWEYKWNEATIEWFDHAVSGERWLNRTGMLCAYFCWHFDGTSLRGKYTMDNFEEMTLNVLKAIIDNAALDGSSEEQVYPGEGKEKRI